MIAKIVLTIISLLQVTVPHQYDSIDHTNAYRVAHGKEVLQREVRADVQERAKYLYEHKPISHENWTTFINKKYGEAGENICDKGYWKEKDFHIDTELNCIDAFKASPTHNDNLLYEWDTVTKGEYGDIIVYWYFN